jgi:MFS family permease
MVVMSSAFFILASTQDLSNHVAWFIASAFIVAIGNGIGSGILLTLGSDLADKKNPAPFLGAWRFVTDSGAALAPLGIASLTAAISLGAAAFAVGIAGVIGTIMMMAYVPRYISRTK